MDVLYEQCLSYAEVFLGPKVATPHPTLLNLRCIKYGSYGLIAAFEPDQVE